MSDIAIPLQPLTVPPATCLPSTLQDLVNVLAECLQVPLPDGYTQIVVSSNTPAPADQGKIWLKLDGAGNPIAFYKYAGGAWVPVAPQSMFWAADGGTVNALSIGEDVIVTRLLVPAMLAGLQDNESYRLTQVRAAFVGGSFGSTDLTIAFTEKATAVLADITIIVL